LTPPGNYSDDLKLSEALRKGDPDAFRFLVEKFQEKIIRTSKGFVHSHHEAEDIAQEVFIEIYRSVDRFRGDSGLSTWIYRITINKSLNYLRSSTRREIISFFELSGSDGQTYRIDPAANPESYPDADINISEQQQALYSAIDNLPYKQKTAFILSKYEELSYKEIANIMRVSVSSVESLIFRAKQNLQRRLYTFYKKNML
jgi:RNA polymerase sigma factor (sigma-70 family)